MGDKFLTDTAQSLIVTLPTSHASLPRSRRRLTVVLANPLKTTPSLLSLETLLLSSWSQASRLRLQRRLSRRNETASRGNKSQLKSSNVLNPGLRNSGNFLSTAVSLKLACTSIAKNFAGYSLHCYDILSCPNAKIIIIRPIRS